MGDKMQQNQPPQHHNMGMNNWSQHWQNLQNPFVQPRSFAYWPPWGAQYSVNMTPGNGVLPHPPMPFQSLHVQSFGYPHQINSNISFNSNSNGTNGNPNVINFNNAMTENMANKAKPPLPAASSENKHCNAEEDLRSLENPDKIPLPDGPPPSNKAFPPLPSTNNSNIHSHAPFFNSNSQPIKFNLNQNKSFTPFKLPSKKNKRKKNKNQSSIPFAAMFNKPNISMNFAPVKLYSNNNSNNMNIMNMNNNIMSSHVSSTNNSNNNNGTSSSSSSSGNSSSSNSSNNNNSCDDQNSIAPPLPPVSHTIQVSDCKSNIQENKTIMDTLTAKEIPSIALIQNQQPSHDDWPPSLLEYIKRCYLKCESSIDKDQVGIILKGKITSAMSSNTLFTKNWDLEPLPNLRGNKIDQCQMNNAVNNVNSIGLRGRDKFNDTMKNRLGKNRNYRGPNKRFISKSSTFSCRNFRSRSRSRSTSRSRSRSKSKSRSRSNSGSRSRSSTPSSRRKRRNSDSNSSNESIKAKTLLKSKPDKKNSGKLKRKQKRQAAFFSDITFGEAETASNERLEQRAARFKETLEVPKNVKKPLVIASSISTVAYEDVEGDFEYNDLHIVGTCQDLEKPFLRLTSAPDASQVRPNGVLEKSLELIKTKWLETADYRYTCEQLKSIRQDLTVQGIRNDFTVKVYETHARICLEKGDPEEFNQCQTQLRMLYTDLGGNNKYEFVAYRILYYIYTKNTLDLTIGMGSLSAEEKEDECVKHALQVANAWCMNNYHRFFLLYQCSPKMSSYLIDWFIERERKSAIKTMIKAYRQSLPVIFVAEKLGFESMEKFLEFASTFNLAYCDVERSKIDCKASMASLNNF